MLRLLGSLQLGLVLLLLLAVLAVGGTISPVAPNRYELFYQSIWFRTLLALLALNLTCCTLRTLPQKWRSRSRLFAALDSAAPADGTSWSLGSATELAARLQQAGYRLRRQDRQLLAERWPSGRWGVVIVHLAVLLVMAGAIWGEAGFVGTLNTYLKQPNRHYFDWQAQRDLPLPFSLRVEEFRLRYYPIPLRFDLIDPLTGRPYAQLQRNDHEAFVVPGTAYRVQLRGFDPDARLLTMEVYRNAQPLGTYLVGEGFEQFGRQRNPGFRLTNLEFRDPVLKQTAAGVTIWEGGKQVRQATIQVNEPLTHRGVSIYLVAYNRDPQGHWSVGFQLSKDPGEPLVWAGCCLLMVGFLMVLLLRPRALGIKTLEGEFYLYPLHGWQGEIAERQLRELLRTLPTSP